MALGDRKDGKLVKDIDGMHYICPIIYPNRCDNEAFISEIIDLTNIDKYLKTKNKNSDYHYNVFHVISTAMAKILYLRPKMNYFIANSNLYERNNKTISFVVKKEFNDNGQEGLAIIKVENNDNINTIHNKIKNIIFNERKNNTVDSSSKYMDIFAKKMPRFISKFIVRRIMWLDKHGIVPTSLIESDPYYSSIVITNLGSIKLHSGYHHLTNWGTNSIFLAIGEIKKRNINVNDKNVTKNTIDIGLTIDERIADGYYYSRTIALLRKLLENPELLEEPLDKETDY